MDDRLVVDCCVVQLDNTLYNRHIIIIIIMQPLFNMQCSPFFNMQCTLFPPSTYTSTQGYQGRVVGATDTHVRVELEAQQKIVSIKRELLDPAAPGAARPLHSTPSSGPSGAYVPPMTPMHAAGGRTPMHPGMFSTTGYYFPYTALDLLHRLCNAGACVGIGDSGAPQSDTGARCMEPQLCYPSAHQPGRRPGASPAYRCFHNTRMRVCCRGFCIHLPI